MKEAETNLNDDYLQYKSLIKELNNEKNKIKKIEENLKLKLEEYKSKESLLEDKIIHLDSEKQQIIDEQVAIQKMELTKFKKEIKSLGWYSINNLLPYL